MRPAHLPDSQSHGNMKRFHWSWTQKNNTVSISRSSADPEESQCCLYVVDAVNKKLSETLSSIPRKRIFSSFWHPNFSIYAIFFSNAEGFEDLTHCHFFITVAIWHLFCTITVLEKAEQQLPMQGFVLNAFYIDIGINLCF